MKAWVVSPSWLPRMHVQLYREHGAQGFLIRVLIHGSPHVLNYVSLSPKPSLSYHDYE